MHTCFSKEKCILQVLSSPIRRNIWSKFQLLLSLTPSNVPSSFMLSPMEAGVMSIIYRTIVCSRNVVPARWIPEVHILDIDIHLFRIKHQRDARLVSKLGVFIVWTRIVPDIMLIFSDILQTGQAFCKSLPGSRFRI